MAQINLTCEPVNTGKAVRILLTCETDKITVPDMLKTLIKFCFEQATANRIPMASIVPDPADLKRSSGLILPS